MIDLIFVTEPIVVGYDPDEYVISEDGETVDLLIRVLSHPGGAPRPFTLIVNTADGTASACSIIIHTLAATLARWSI